MRYLTGFFIIGLLAVSSFFILSKKNISNFSEKNQPILSNTSSSQIVDQNVDIEPQKPLANPPNTIKAIYATSWSAATPSKVNSLIKLIKETELNAIVIDIKDFSGYVAYDIKLPEVEKYKAKEIRISKINSLIKKFHDENIYVIARITIFQDPVLANARPDLAIHSRLKLTPNTQNLTPKTLWLDNKKLSWMDPTSKEVWDYNIAIAKDAANRGFDELNFDYIRFPSDGNLNDMVYPFWDKTTLKSNEIKNLFKYLRENLPNDKLSVDLFGLTTVQNDDLGIGQLIENAYQYFDYISPMVYPSHYASGFLNYKNPANYPYEVVKYSMESALQRLKNYELKIANSISTSTSTENLTPKTYNLKTNLRPWLQDFDLGADYNAEMIKREIQAVYDSASSTPELVNGWMLWDAKNIYTKDALQISE